MFSLFDLAAILLTLSAIFGWLNYKFLPLPRTIGLLVMSVVTSLVLVGINFGFPGKHLYDPLTNALLQINFSAVVMNGMLGFLLFAGALNVDLGKLRDRAVPVVILAGFGTVVSTAVVGVAIWESARLIGHPFSFAWALVLGALISPTDPVAVLSTLKNVNVPARLEVEMQGESPFAAPARQTAGIPLHYKKKCRLKAPGQDPDKFRSVQPNRTSAPRSGDWRRRTVDQRLAPGIVG